MGVKPEMDLWKTEWEGMDQVHLEGPMGEGLL
jgi:hypothetical protein